MQVIFRKIMSNLMGLFYEIKGFKGKMHKVYTNLCCMSFRCPLRVQAGHLKIAHVPALLTSLKEFSWSSLPEAQRRPDDEYQDKSMPLPKKHLGVINSH